MTEFHFTNRDEFQIRKPRRQKEQRNPKKTRRIVRKITGLFYTEIKYEDGEIIWRKNEN